MNNGKRKVWKANKSMRKHWFSRNVNNNKQKSKQMPKRETEKLTLWSFCVWLTKRRYNVIKNWLNSSMFLWVLWSILSFSKLKLNVFNNEKWGFGFFLVSPSVSAPVATSPSSLKLNPHSLSDCRLALSCYHLRT